MGWEFGALTGSEVATIAGIAAALVILWFLFRPRPPRIVVSSHVLWDTVAPKGRNPLVKELLMLALQLAMVCGLAVALGDPQRVADDVEAESSSAPLDRLHVVDTSLSMGAAAGAGSRLDVVRAAILGDLAELPDAVRVGLVGAGRTPELLSPLEADRSRLRLALRLLRPEGVGADLEQALALAVAAPTLRRGRSVIEVWTDRPDAPDLLAAFTEATAVSAVLRSPFGPAPNLAVVAFDLRAAEGIPAEEEALVRVANPSPWPAAAVLALETEDAILGESRITIPAGQEVQRQYRFQPLPGSGIEARLRDVVFTDGPVDVDGTPLGDALAADDVAYAWVQPVEPVTVLLVTDGDRFLERVLALLPGIQLTQLTPQQYRERKGRGGDAVDVVFFDRFAPLPKRDGPLPPRAVLFGPPGSRSPIPAVGAADKPVVTDWNRAHPLFEGLVLRDLTIEQSVVLEPQDGDVRLIGTTSGALVVARTDGERRLVVWGFPLSASDLPLRLAFPQTIVNVILWMRADRAVGEAPGQRWRLDDPLWLDGPGTATVTDLRQEAYATRSADPIALRRATWEVGLGDGPTGARFPRPGLFRVDGPGAELVAVNLETLEESRTADVPLSDGGPVAHPPEPPSAPPDGRRPWWMLSLVVAAVALIEFGIYTR